MTRREQRIESLRIHKMAKKYQEDLRAVFSAFEQIGISEWDVIGKFSLFLKNKGHKIEPSTIYGYLYRDIFPAWLNPFLCDFLSQEPYLNSPIIWRFIRDWFKPTALIVERVRGRIETEKHKIQRKIQEFEAW